MTDEQLQKLLLLIHRPIPWDPVPWWIRLSKDQITKFNEVQTTLNAKLAEIQAEKMNALSEIIGMQMK
jgi:hypothetical protein